MFAANSVAQELHHCGVPVVVGSQLPLTKPGIAPARQSVFYVRLLRGEDVRVAFHAARVDLRADETTGHDWLSLVGYVGCLPKDMPPISTKSDCEWSCGCSMRRRHAPMG